MTRTVISDSTHLNDNGNGSYFESLLNCKFERKQIKKKFKHARLGSFRGKGVHHYFNPETKLNIMNG